MNDEGNVVIGHTVDSNLMLDYDMQTEDKAIKFTKKYAKFHKLGSALVCLTSEPKQMTFDGHILNNYCGIFGKKIDKREVMLHVKEAYRLGMVKKDFLALRQFGYITIRVNAKNDEKPYPKPIYYFRNGDSRGVMEFLRLWATCKNLG